MVQMQPLQHRNGALLPFMFDNIPVRGKVLRLPNLTDQIQALAADESELARLLGELLASAALLAFDLKTAADVTLQIHGDGKLPLLVAQCSRDGILRAYAKKEGPVTPADVKEAQAEAERVFAVTFDTVETGERYQSFVPIQSLAIQESIEAYFERSAQLKTCIRVFCGVDAYGKTSCGAMFLQAMPSKITVSDDDWKRLGFILDTLKLEEILPGALSETDLLLRLFAEDTVRVFPPHTLTFVHRASRARMENALISLGAETCRELIAEGPIEMTCEFTGTKEIFTLDDLKALFGDGWGYTN